MITDWLNWWCYLNYDIFSVQFQYLKTTLSEIAYGCIIAHQTLNVLDKIHPLDTGVSNWDYKAYLDVPHGWNAGHKLRI